tara:strand:+ start:1459 stop:2631 length:1173 start_codon:yes stop_codon:yes gene_type:complete
MKLQIQKPDDSNQWYSTSITCATHKFPDSHSLTFNRSAKDPVHDGLEQYWRLVLSPRKKESRRRYRPVRHQFNSTFNHVVMINGCPISLVREGIRYQINGKSYSLATCASALARITFKSCFEDDPATLMISLYSTLSLPENVKYCMENRAPYHFYVDYTKINVRLRVQQIGDKEMAIEVGDGLWGTMSVKDLDTYCNFYVHGKSRGSWKRLSPEHLYMRVLNKTPTESELKVMIAFLQQNRTKDLVEARALELVNDMLIQHKDRLFAHYENDVLHSLLVKGNDFDWKLTNNSYKSDIQMVSTYVWQPSKSRTKVLDEETGEEVSVVKLGEPEWKGPICIDNMAGGSPLGDQFAARALALLNDSFTIKIVNTISNYLVAEPNEYRADKDEM